MENQIPLEENILLREVDDGLHLPSSSQANLPQKPAKKPTRQWAAWTRQEEENFFSALRQVGKNFEKITCRVQSKNKDQVRHYYYRLVRRMNKLLGPGFCIDAKNSKDTIAAMLRWWSLLEKYNCTASKLHLKPRRFKIFVEALENQLLKDRSKTRRKRLPGDIYLPTSAPLLGKGLGGSTNSKALPLDLSGVKMASGKGAPYKLEMCSNINFSRRYLTNMKALRQKQRPGLVASSAYKRWEKAAFAGVSLVAEAAEHLEQTSNAKCTFSGGSSDVLPNEMNTNNVVCPTDNYEIVMETCRKLKLQLFPIDECTRRALEKDEHNPHLELTLSARKRISAVLEHISRKWGNSSIATGELMLFPYTVQEEDLTSSIRWTIADTVTSTAEVYSIVGSPTLFRLRYGWFSTAKTELGVQVAHVADYYDTSLLNGVCQQALECPEGQSTLVVDLTASVGGTTKLLTEGSSHDIAKDAGEVTAGKKYFELSCGEWAACLTNLSVGDLLNEASTAAEYSCASYTKGASPPSIQQDAQSCDSFDVAIAAHVSDVQLSTKCSQPSSSSIFNAEETCDEFSFRIGAIKKQKGLESLVETPASYGQSMLMSSEGSEKSHKVMSMVDNPDVAQCDDVREVAEPINHLYCDVKADDGKDTCITDVYWPDSLGPLDLDIASSNFRGQDLIIEESLSFSGFSRLFSNSLDAVQGCLLFSMEKDC